MNWKLSWKGYRVGVYWRKEHRTLGVNSLLPDGKHFLMWDFDNVRFDTVLNELLETQRKYALPPIHILQSSAGDNFHAYCFRAFPWHVTLSILAFSDSLDHAYFSIGVIRRHFTLRFRDKHSAPIVLRCVLPSEETEDVRPAQLENFSEYYTAKE